MLAANAAQEDPVAAVVAAENGRIIFSGKIVDVTRKTAAGFVRGDLIVREVAGRGESEDICKPLQECKLHFRASTVPVLACVNTCGHATVAQRCCLYVLSLSVRSNARTAMHNVTQKTSI